MSAAAPLAWPALAAPRQGALWTAAEIAVATGGRASDEFAVAGVETDSRFVQEGDLFVALKGASADGHRFAGQAFAKGAAAALVSEPVAGPHVLVEDTGAALVALGQAARRRMHGRVIGVTGSVGKTGVKEAIFASLERASRGAAHRSVKSYNNHVGVPLSLARMAATSRFGVFEMGMSNAGEIAALTQQVRPDVAVITAIAPAHIAQLGSIEAIAAAKAEIFAGLPVGGVAVIPADSEHYPLLARAAEAAGARVVGFGRSAHASARLLDALPDASGGALVTADICGRRLCYTVSEPGEHWIGNSLAVMAAVVAAGGDPGAAGLALAGLGGLKGRGARRRVKAAGGHALLIDESYNANPASMRATLASLASTPAARRIAVLGAMKELGDFSAPYHARLAEPLLAAGVDFALLVGEEMAPLAAELGKGRRNMLGNRVRFAHCGSAGEAIVALAGFGLAGGDAVLVKGSNSVGLARLVDHFAAQEG